MNILGTIPKGGCTFEELLQRICARNPRRLGRQLLKTSQSTGFLTDNSILSKMTEKEAIELGKKHWDALLSDERYPDAEVFRLELALPRHLGTEIESARYVGGNKKVRLVLLQGSGLEAFVDCHSFSTLQARHQESTWWFAARNHDERPVVLLKSKGFFKGELLGTIATIPLEREEVTSQRLEEPKIRWKRNGCRYLEVKS